MQGRPCQLPKFQNKTDDLELFEFDVVRELHQMRSVSPQVSSGQLVPLAHFIVNRRLARVTRSFQAIEEVFLLLPPRAVPLYVFPPSRT